LCDKAIDRTHIDKARIVAQQRRPAPRSASAERSKIESDGLAAIGVRHPRLRIEPHASRVGPLRPRPRRQRLKIDQPGITRVLSGEPARHHARIAQVPVRGQQHHADGRRRTAANPVSQYRDMSMPPADQQQGLVARIRPGQSHRLPHAASCAVQLPARLSR
jgi:hypothetical protein